MESVDNDAVCDPCSIIPTITHCLLQFLDRLTEIFSQSSHGSVWLTHKRCPNTSFIRGFKSNACLTVKRGHDQGSESFPCLIRAVKAKSSSSPKTQFSTTVDFTQLFKFYAAYSTLLKSHLSTVLRKRDKKREKQRADQAAKRKQRMTEPIVLDGPKRGAGRRKRQRQIQAQKKQEIAKVKLEQRLRGAKPISDK